jgi:hypothetical protein
MRNAGRLKLGYYPLPTEEGRRLRRLIQCDAPFSVLDPSVGTGAALHVITADCDCRHPLLRAPTAAKVQTRSTSRTYFSQTALSRLLGGC